jgi:LuxR family maltose regulon positive regulatory protein
LHDAALESILASSSVPDFRSRVLACAPARVLTRVIAADLLPAEVSALEVFEAAHKLDLLTPVDSDLLSTPAWQFPAVVREALLDMARREDSHSVESALMTLSRRAGQLDDHALAARYAADAGSWPVALDILERHWVVMVTRHLSRLRELLDEVPDDLLQQRPSVQAGKAVFVGMLAHAPALDPTLPDSDADVFALAADPAVATVIHVATVQAIGLRVAGRYLDAVTMTRRVEALATAAVDRQPSLVHGQLPILRLQWAITFQLAGADIDATAQFMQAYHGAAAGDIGFVARNSAGNLALLWAVSGHIPRARMWLARELDFDDGGAVLAPMVRVGGAVATALTCMDQLDVDAARTTLEELGEPTHREELWAYIAYACAQYALLTGSAYSASALLQRLAAERVVQCSPTSLARVLITAARIDLHLALDQANLAAACLTETTLDHPMLITAAARVALHTGDPERALTIVAQSVSPDSGAPRVYIEALLVQAAAHWALGASEKAIRCWRTACELADQSECYRPFTTLATSVRNALAMESGTAPARAVEISVFPEAIAFVELTTREREILTSLAAGLSQQQIAIKQFVSPNTVKTQVRSLYRKLGAHSKAEALTIARTLRLLDPPVVGTEPPPLPTVDAYESRLP